MARPRTAIERGPCVCRAAPRTTHSAVAVPVAPLRPDVPPFSTSGCARVPGGQHRTWRWRWRSLDHELAPDFPPPRRSTGRLTGSRLHAARKAAGVRLD